MLKKNVKVFLSFYGNYVNFVRSLVLRKKLLVKKITLQHDKSEFAVIQFGKHFEKGGCFVIRLLCVWGMEGKGPS